VWSFIKTQSQKNQSILGIKELCFAASIRLSPPNSINSALHALRRKLNPGNIKLGVPICIFASDLELHNINAYVPFHTGKTVLHPWKSAKLLPLMPRRSINATLSSFSPTKGRNVKNAVLGRCIQTGDLIREGIQYRYLAELAVENGRPFEGGCVQDGGLSSGSRSQADSPGGWPGQVGLGVRIVNRFAHLRHFCDDWEFELGL